MNKICPKNLNSPHIEMGITLKDGLEILEQYGVPEQSKDKKELSYKVTTPDFDIAIYEKNGIIFGAWYNDPLGRVWSFGKKRKINLYLARYDSLQHWEARMNNGYIQFYFNDIKGISMAYGIHNDVIRFNLNGL